MTRIIDTGNFTNGSTVVHSIVFTFEENFSPRRARQWMKENLNHGFFFCGIYVFLIFFIQLYMRNKPRYQLRTLLALWNASLSIFSILGTLRLVPELFHMVIDHSLYHSVCYPIILEPIKVTEFWTWLFALSKLLELGDTMFIVLRKQPLIFLHWYHHVTVLLVAWTSYAGHYDFHRWFRAMNYSVHSFMYLYYCLRAMGFSVPKFIMISITLLQIVQMIIGCMIVSMGFHYRLTDQPCQVSNWNIVISGCMYFSYLILFSRLFYKMYLNPSKKKYFPTPDNMKIKQK